MASILEKIAAHLQTHCLAAWEGTFHDYLALVLQQPTLAQRAHARLYNMINAAGCAWMRVVRSTMPFSSMTSSVSMSPWRKVVEYFKAAALGSDVGRRILLLYGPPSSGKSQLVILLKRGLEAYTHTDAGAVYAIADCPQHEDPLNLVPHALRQDFQEETGIHIEGELCPLCALTPAGKIPGRHLSGAGEAHLLLGKRALRHRHLCAVGSEIPGHFRTGGQYRSVHHRRLRLRVRPARLSLRWRTQCRQPRPDGIYRNAQGRRALSLCVADAVAGKKHQNRPFSVDLCRRVRHFAHQ